MSSSAYIDNKVKDISILGEGLTQGFDNSTLTAEAINFTQPNKRFVLSLHYSGSNSLLFVNAAKIYQFKAKNSERKYYALCLGNMSKDLQLITWKKLRLKGIVKFFCVGFSSIDTNDILDVLKHSMKRKWYKIMFGLIKKMFIVLLSNIVNGSIIQSACHWAIKNVWFHLPLLIYILMNTVKNFSTIDLRLN